MRNARVFSMGEMGNTKPGDLAFVPSTRPKFHHLLIFRIPKKGSYALVEERPWRDYGGTTRFLYISSLWQNSFAGRMKQCPTHSSEGISTWIGTHQGSSWDFKESTLELIVGKLGNLP